MGRPERGVFYHDHVAGFSAAIVVVGTVVMGILQIPIPSEYAATQGAAVTWLFVRSVQAAADKGRDDRPENNSSEPTKRP